MPALPGWGQNISAPSPKLIASAGSDGERYFAIEAPTVQQTTAVEKVWHNTDPDPSAIVTSFGRGPELTLKEHLSIAPARMSLISPPGFLTDYAINAMRSILTGNGVLGSLAVQKGSRVNVRISIMSTFQMKALHSDMKMNPDHALQHSRNIKHFKNVDFATVHAVLLPTNNRPDDGDHWFMCALNFWARRMEIFDSGKRYSNHATFFRIMRRLLEAVHALGKANINLDDWIEYTAPVSQQPENDVSCGIYTVYSMQCAAQGLPAPNFRGADLDALRYKYAAEVLSGEVGALYG